MEYESGAWNVEWREKSSNCREAKNLTDRLERLVADGALRNHEVFLITNTSAFEGAFYKGHSQSRELSVCFRSTRLNVMGGLCYTSFTSLGNR